MKETLASILFEHWPAYCIGIFGAFARLIFSTEKDISVRLLIGTFMTAGFVGMLLSLYLYERDLSIALKGFLIGAVSSTTREALTFIQAISKKLLGVMTNVDSK